MGNKLKEVFSNQEISYKGKLVLRIKKRMRILLKH